MVFELEPTKALNLFRSNLRSRSQFGCAKRTFFSGWRSRRRSFAGNTFHSVALHLDYAQCRFILFMKNQSTTNMPKKTEVQQFKDYKK